MYQINYPVNMVMMDNEDVSTKNLEKVSEYAIWGFKSLKFKILPGVSVTELRPNAVGTAAMPSDYLFYTKVAITINGCAYTLSVNNRIKIPQRHCGVEIADICRCGAGDMPDINAFNGVGFGYASHYRAGNYVAEYFSLGGGNNTAGYFREDTERQQFIFQGIPFNLPIVLEYVSDGSNGLDQIIPATAVMPIRNYVHWQLKLHARGKAKASLQEIQMAENNFLVSKQELRNITNTPTVDDFCDLMYAGFQSAPGGVALN